MGGFLKESPKPPKNFQYIFYFDLEKLLTKDIIYDSIVGNGWI